ncbi:MAG: nucleotidyltransferase family protein [Mucinivorans sp.]
MSRESSLLFALLRATLWSRTVEVELFQGVSSEQWRVVFRLASQGAVVGLSFDAIGRLPLELRPPRPVFMQWLAVAEQKREHNRLLREVAQVVAELYDKAGVEFVLVKGLGVAELYPDKLMRDGGDLDLLIIKGYDRANEVLLENGAIFTSNNPKHHSFQFRGVSIENHHQLSIISPSGKPLTPLYGGSTLSGCQIAIPSTTFNSIYLVEHMAMHFFIYGIGLRHVCDLCCLYSRQGSSIDRQAMSEGLKSIGGTPLLQRLGVVLIDNLGLDPSLLPFVPIRDRMVEPLLRDIIEGGNFGFYAMTPRTNNRYYNKLLTMRAMVARSWKFRHLGSSFFLKQIRELIVFNFKALFGR